jgi:hypothetical protein
MLGALWVVTPGTWHLSVIIPGSGVDEQALCSQHASVHVHSSFEPYDLGRAGHVAGVPCWFAVVAIWSYYATGVFVIDNC